MSTWWIESVSSLDCGIAEPAVLVFARQPVFEDDHRRDDVRAAQVRDVVALDAERGVGHAERLLDVLERLASASMKSALRRVL